jgi:cholestenol delta-isomerase
LLPSPDYRYGDYNGMMESGTTAMELITAVIDGPLCFLVVFAAAHDLSWRHPLQIILCTMQLYGLVWFTLQPIYSDTGLAGHFSSDPVSGTYCACYAWLSICSIPVAHLVCIGAEVNALYNR